MKTEKLLENIKQLKNGYHISDKDLRFTMDELLKINNLIVQRLINR